MDNELFYDQETEKGYGIIINEYNGRYMLVEAKKSSKGNGAIYKTMCYKEFDKKPGDKRTIHGVQIGNKTEAVKFFKWALSQLDVTATAQPAKGDDGSIPF